MEMMTNKPTNRSRNKLPKSTKLRSVSAIDALFASGRGALAYPLRVVIMESDGPGIRFLISVPKRRLRHAVDRVAMRRRIRESYRLLRPSLPEGLNINIAFIYIANERVDSARISEAMRRLLNDFSADK